jgi:hypothetical protein
MVTARRRRSSVSVGTRAGQRAPAVRSSAGVERPQWFATTVRVVAALLSSTAALTALLIYFGRVRSTALFLYFGVDQSVLSFAPQESVIRSINVLFWPMMGSAIATLAAVLLYGYADRAHGGHVAHVALRTTWMSMFACAAALIAVAAVAYGRGRPAQPPGVARLYWVPLLVLAAALLGGFGVMLMARLERLPWLSLWRPISGVVGTLAVTLVVLWAFWALGEFASFSGRQRAIAVASHLDQLPHVTLYAEEDIGLEGPGVSGSQLDLGASRRAFAYSGLRFMRRDDGRYLLLPCGWTVGDPVMLLREAADLRVEFSTGGTGESCSLQMSRSARAP